MTEIFEKNLKVMDKWYPAYGKLVRDRAEEGVEETLTIREETSWDGERIFCIEKEDRRLYLNGKRNAGRAVSTWMERLGEIHKYAPVLLLGLGSGLYLKKLCETADETVNIIVYEPSMEIFFYTLNHVDLSGCMEKRMIAWVVEGINEKELGGVVGKLVSLETVGFFKTETHPNYQELFPEQTLKTLKLAGKRAKDLLMQVRTRVRFSDVIIRNQFENMRYVMEGYNTLELTKALNRNCPAVLVAAGPSLNKNIKELKKAKNRAFILAVDTALKPLLKEGILPDAFITIDGKKPLMLVEADEAQNIPVIAPTTANYELLGRQKGKRIFYNDGHMLAYVAYAAAGKIMPAASTGGSVACSGFSLLYKMGFPTIILVGQDLAYTDKKSHADGTFQEVMPQEDTRQMMTVKGNYEDKVPTRLDFKTYLEWYEMYIAAAKEHDPKLRIINATEGGAWIEGTELMHLGDALEETCGDKIDFGSAIQALEPDFTDEDREKIEQCLWDISQEFTEIKKNAKKLRAAYKKVGQLSKAGELDAGVYMKQLKKIKKLNKSCEEGTAYTLISSCIPLAEFIVTNESLESLDSLEEEAQAISRQGVKYAEIIMQCAEMLQEYMVEAFGDFKVFKELTAKERSESKPYDGEEGRDRDESFNGSI